MSRRRNKGMVALALLAALAPAVVAPAQAQKRNKKGKLAVLNAGTRGHEVVERATSVLSRHIGGWAGQPGISDYLTARPNPGALPVGDTGKDLVRLVERVRTERVASRKDLGELARLLGVDYLLLMRVGASTFVARLYSVHRATYGPRKLEAKIAEVGLLDGYVVEQTGADASKPTKRSRWWIWAIAGGLAALTIGLALSTGSNTEGDLRIRVSR